MRTKLLAIIILIIFGSPISYSQLSLEGTILNNEKAPISFANVVLLNQKDSSYVKGGLSNEAGSFSWNNLPQENYILNISFIGFEDKFIPVALNANIVLDEIILQEESATLGTVTVAARRKLISRKIDRLVFDVENSIRASQGDAIDVLSVTPGVRVRNESINMIGKSGVSVMINDKLVKLSGEDLSSFLRSIASEDIQNIEVITVPPSKYDAQGNSGLINIQLKKAKTDSWNASIRGDYRQRTHSRYNTGAGFNFNKNSLSITSSLDYLVGTYRQSQENYAHFPEGLWFTDSPFDRAFGELGGRLGIGYKISPKWTIGGQYIYKFVDQNTQDTPNTSVSDYETNDTLQLLNSRGNIDQRRHIHSFNFYNQIDLDTTGKKVNINLDFFNFDDWEDKKYNGFSRINTPLTNHYFAGVNTNNQLITNASAAIDFTFPSNVVNLEFGGKYTLSKSMNDIDFFNSGLVDDPVINLSTAENDFEYTERVQAAYVSARKKMNDQISLQAGLRMEATQTSSVANNIGVNQENKYLKLFPTFYLKYSPTENTSLNFSYNRRISRAPFFMLTPNPWVETPFQSVVGNPFLQPSYADNFEISSGFKNLNISAYYNYEEDVFTQVPIPDADNNIMVFKFQNFLDIKRTGINIDYLFENLNWWSSSNSIDFNYSINNYLEEGTTIQKKGYASNFYTSNDFTLKKDRAISLNITYWYSPAGLDEFWKIKAMSNLSASLQFLLLDKKLKLTLRANDIFKTQKERITATVDGVFQDVFVYYDSRYVGLVANYSFGNSNISTNRNKIGNQEERNRAGRF